MKMNGPAGRLANRAGSPYNGVVATLTLEYWREGRWYCGRLKEVPGVISQGRTFKSLQNNIRDAYRLMMSVTPKLDWPAKKRPIRVD